MNYFVASAYLEDLEETVTIDALHGDIAIADSISTSNVQSSNADIGILESYSFASTLGFTSNLLSSKVQTTQIIAQNAPINTLTFSGASRSNLVVTDLSSDDGDFYNVQTSLLSASNASVSNLLAHYVDASTILGSNVYILSQLQDRSNVPIIGSNSKIDSASLKNIPESDGGLSLFDIASAAYDGLQTISDLYDKLKGLTQDVPELPEEVSNPLKDALGSNESSNPIYVDWSKLTSRPIATTTNSFDVGFKSDIYVFDASRMLTIGQGQFSQSAGNLYNTKTASNLVLDFLSKTAYLDKVQLYGACNSMTIQSNCITAPVIYFNSNTSITSTGLTTTALAATTASVPTITTNNVSSTCNLTLRTSNYMQLTSCNLNVSQSNLTWI
jgi:hypothetical protein